MAARRVLSVHSIFREVPIKPRVRSCLVTSCADQVLPERARPARIVAQHRGTRRQAPGQIARGRHRARPTGRSEAESDPFRGSGRGPEDGVCRERRSFGRRARAADSPARNAAFGGRRLAAIATTDINRFILTRQADVMAASAGDDRKERRFSNGEINRELTTLKRIFIWRVKTGS